MSRIFQALQKADVTRVAIPAAAPPAPATPARSAAPLAIAPRPTAPATVAKRATVVAALPEQVTREMVTLRVNLESALPAGRARAVEFMSSQGGEGTSTVAAQFVITLTGDGQTRVLFVDANALHPALHTGPVAAGPLLGLFAPAAASSAGPTVDLLPVSDSIRLAGMYAPADLAAVLDAARERYDWIVIDGPPVLHASEASGLGSVADAVVMVVEAGRTKRPVLSRAVELLRKAGARVLGSVLNRRTLEIPEFIYRRI